MNYNCNLECFLEIEKMIWFCIFPCLVFNCRSHWFYLFVPSLSSVQLSHSVMSDPLWPHGSCSKPGLPVPHQLLEFIQTQVHWVGDAIQPSHSLSPPSPFTFNLSQHQGLFPWVGSLHLVAKVLELQHQSLHWIFRVDFSFSIGEIWFPLDWFDLLAVQVIPKSLLQHHSSKATSHPLRCL